MLLLAACGGDEVEEESSTDAFTTIASSEIGRAPAGAPVRPAIGFAEAAPAPSALGNDEAFASAGTLETAQRQVISTASLSVEVEDVDAAAAQVRVIAEGRGGFVEHLSSFGGPDNPRATMTIRVPQEQFSVTLESIEALGQVESQNLGSEDVTEQFIDLEARLKSALRQEESLLSLLGRAQSVSDVLTIERELNRVRSEIERFQGQLNFLERRVALATITVSLFTPAEERPEPPSASLVIKVSDVSGRTEEVKALVSTLDGEVDSVFLSVRNGKETAEMAFRVFIADFEQALASIESRGDVLSKDLFEGSTPAPEEVARGEEPDARFRLSLIEKEGSNTGLIVAIAAPIGGVALTILLGVLLYLTYRAGRRRTAGG